MGSKSRLLQVLTGKNGVNSVPTQGLKWRRGRDSNPRYGFPHTHFPGVRLQPLGHPSSTRLSRASRAHNTSRPSGASRIGARVDTAHGFS